MAFKIIAAIVFGILIGLDRHIAGKPMALAKNIGISLFGLFFGAVCLGFDLQAAGEMAFAGEGLAGFGLFALIYHELGDSAQDDLSAEAPLWRAAARLLDPAPAFALGLACALSAWTVALAGLAVKVVFNSWRLARSHLASPRRDLDLDFDPSGPGAECDLAAFCDPALSSSGAGVEWLAGQPPASFAATLAAEPIAAHARMSREHRQTEAAHNGARTLDARSAATPRPIDFGCEIAERCKNRIGARDQAHGRP